MYKVNDNYQSSDIIGNSLITRKEVFEHTCY